MLIDVHSHLDFPDFEKDFDKVLERAKEAGVFAIISAGVNPESNRKVLEIAGKYPIVKPALGIYPSDALKMSDSEIENEIGFIRKSGPFAVSEVGLDGTYPEMEKQKLVFEKFIMLAKELDVPLIVHSRKAESETVEMLARLEAKKVVVHCFMGKLSIAKQIEDNGWLFSVPCIIQTSSQFQELVKKVKSTHLLTETDAPLLSAVKGKRNEPAFAADTIKKMAEIKGVAKEEMEKMVFMNYQRLFMGGPQKALNL
ncbi:MAG TPA: TatD family hydrolase [Nanoarchaeota archaeon]|nr:TatD family hydrolase [Nanoarchaeota archaeon]